MSRIPVGQPLYGSRSTSPPGQFRHFAMIAGSNSPAIRATGDWLMGRVDLWRRKAEDCLEKAHAISDRQRARLLLVQAHNYLKNAEEREAQQLSARRPTETLDV